MVDFDNSNRRFQTEIWILKIPPVFDDPKAFQMEIWSLMNEVCCGPKVISSDDMDFDDSKVLMIPMIPPSLIVLFLFGNFFISHHLCTF